MDLADITALNALDIARGAMTTVRTLEARVRTLEYQVEQLQAARMTTASGPVC